MGRRHADRVAGDRAPSDDLFVSGGFLRAVNAAQITGAHLARAASTIEPVPVRSPDDIARHGRLLETFARDHKLGEYGGAALHARAIALDRWACQYDPFGETDLDGFYAAGSSAPLVESDKGLAFDPAVFAAEIEKWSKIFA